jgi:hypothetical protein
LTLERVRRFEFTESGPELPFEIEPGLDEFLNDPSLSGDATQEEITFLKSLKLQGRRPTPLYYYRALQNLRDPLHFRSASSDPQPAPKRSFAAKRFPGKGKTTVRARGGRKRNKKQRV